MNSIATSSGDRCGSERRRRNGVLPKKKILSPSLSALAIITPRGNGLERMLHLAVRSSFLAFGNQGLWTSTVQVRNRTTGAAVSLTKKSDVKNHLSRRHPTGIHIYQPASQPDATGFSGEESAHTDSQTGHVDQGSTSKPGLRSQGTPTTATDSGLKPTLVPKVSKSARP
jgi:hypothetical protein